METRGLPVLRRRRDDGGAAAAGGAGCCILLDDAHLEHILLDDAHLEYILLLLVVVDVVEIEWVVFARILSIESRTEGW